MPADVDYGHFFAEVVADFAFGVADTVHGFVAPVAAFPVEGDDAGGMEREGDFLSGDIGDCDGVEPACADVHTEGCDGKHQEGGK